MTSDGRSGGAARSGRRTTPDRTLADREELSRLAWLMDEVFTLPGTKRRFGLDALIGLVPGVGDAASTGVGLYLVARALLAGLPRVVVARMLVNTLLDAVVGIIPILGDAFDFAYKSNSRNLALYRRYAGDPSASTAGQWSFLVGLMLVLAGVAWLFFLAAERLLSALGGGL